MNNEIQEGQFEEISSAPEQKTSMSDKIGDLLGAWVGAVVLTYLAAVLLGAFFTIIPAVKFNLVVILKCWAGIWGLMFARGALKNKML